MRHPLLMQSIIGHLALLAEKHPKKASTSIARRAKLAAYASLRSAQRPVVFP